MVKLLFIFSPKKPTLLLFYFLLKNIRSDMLKGFDLE